MRALLRLGTHPLAMKPPTEAELIELEDWLTYQFYETDLHGTYRRNPMLSQDRAIERIQFLILLARDQNAERWSAKDLELIKRDHTKRMFARQPPRKAEPEPVSSVHPKQIGKSQKIRKR